MRKDLVRIKPLTSSFLSCETDIQLILKKLFIENRPYSNLLKRLLVVNTKDCLDNDKYANMIDKISITDLREQGYIKLEPKIRFPENEEVKAYIIITFDNFTLNDSNPEYRDCTIHFDIICHTDQWDLGDYRLRPLKIAGYIDGILNENHLTGIGKLHLIGCNMLVLDENLSGYTLMYRAIHDKEDKDISTSPEILTQ